MIAHQTMNRRLSTLPAASMLAACSGCGQSFRHGRSECGHRTDGGLDRACMQGEAPLICISGPNGETGLVELLQFQTDHATVQALAEDFVASMATDRTAGCGDGYVIEAIPPTPMPLSSERKEFASVMSAALATARFPSGTSSTPSCGWPGDASNRGRLCRRRLPGSRRARLVQSQRVGELR